MIRIHTSYHKCLTVYFQRVNKSLHSTVLHNTYGYKHFQSKLAEFNKNIKTFKVISVNNHFVDFTKFTEDYRISRFIRDPRDIIVSGYFYHKKGSEKWCNISNPKSEDFEIVNGNMPTNFLKNESFATYLQKLSKENGIIAEIDFRKKMLNSMLEWPDKHEKIKLYKYEDILGNEKEVINDLLKFYELPWHERRIGIILAEKYSAKKIKKYKHIRNATPRQWKEHFTPKIENYFNDNFGDIIKKYGYDT